MNQPAANPMKNRSFAFVKKGAIIKYQVNTQIDSKKTQ